MTKIIYLHRTQGKGAEGSHIRGMVNGFRKNGCSVDIVGPPSIDPYSKEDFTKTYEQKILVKILKGFAENTPQIVFECTELIYNLFAFIRLKHQFNHVKNYSFLYERYALNSFAGALISIKNKIPFVLEVNDATVIQRSRPLILNKISILIESWIFKKANLIITITTHFKDKIVKTHEINPDKIMVLPNAIDPENFIILKKNKKLRNQIGIPDTCKVIGCVGAFLAWHGLEFLVETMADECESMDLFFLFIGDGPVRNIVQEKAEVLGVNHRVMFTGFVSPDQVPPLLDLVDICVIPQSPPHCSPMKLFEYMAAKKPIVLPSYKALSEIITDGENGYFFEPNNSIQLKSILSKLIFSNEIRQSLGKNAKKLVQQKYTWNSNSLRVLKAINAKNRITH